MILELALGYKLIALNKASTCQNIPKILTRNEIKYPLKKYFMKKECTIKSS